MSTEPKRRLTVGDVAQAAGLVLVTGGVMTIDFAAGLITAGIAFLWIGWSNS